MPLVSSEGSAPITSWLRLANLPVDGLNGSSTRPSLTGRAKGIELGVAKTRLAQALHRLARGVLIRKETKDTPALDLHDVTSVIVRKGVKLILSWPEESYVRWD